MTENPSRRDFLRYAGAATGLGFVGQASGTRSDRRAESVATPYDISVTDNTRSSNRVRVELFEKGGGNVLFSRTYGLHGMNNDQRPPDASTRERHAIDVSGDGTFVVEATLPDGSSDRIEFHATGTILSDVEGVSVSVYPGGTVKVSYGGV